jgi:hypothetical protein
MARERDVAPALAVLRAAKPDLTPAELDAFRWLLNPKRFHDTVRATTERDDEADLKELWRLIETAGYWRVRQEAARSGVQGLRIAFTRKQRDAIRAAAKAAGMDSNEFARRAALSAAGLPVDTGPPRKLAVQLPDPAIFKRLIVKVLGSRAVLHPGYFRTRVAADYGVTVAGIWTTVTGETPKTTDLHREKRDGKFPSLAAFAEAAFTYAGLSNWAHHTREGASRIRRALLAGQTILDIVENQIPPTSQNGMP